MFFLRKIKTHVIPYVDLLAWCLMPNHFHLMGAVREEELYVNPEAAASSGGATISRTPTRCSLIETLSPTPPTCPTYQIPKKISLNHSIGIMLASYTRAIHEQENISGSLFRQKTKSECLNLSNGIMPSFINTKAGTLIDNIVPEEQYPQICFEYIHNNPVAAGFVREVTNWEFSSAQDYAGLRAGGIVAKQVAGEYLSPEYIFLNKNR